MLLLLHNAFDGTCRSMPKKHENPHQRSNGWWYYRRRIPNHLRRLWRGDGGHQTEHIVALKTKDEAEAKRRSTFEDRVFEDKLGLKEVQLEAIKNPEGNRERNSYYFEDRLKQVGLHPDQKPDIDSPREVIQKFLRDRQAFAYGSWDRTYQQLYGGLYDEIHELASEYDQTGDPQTKRKLDAATHKLNLLMGKAKNRDARTGAPSLAVAKAEYLKYIENKASPNEAKKDEARRLDRLVDLLAFVLGDGDPRLGLQRSIASIRKGEVTLLLKRLGHREDGSSTPKAPSTIGRELQTISTMWKMAYEEREEDWPADANRVNPFGKRRSKLNKQHEHSKKAGLVEDKDRRPFTPRELEIFLTEHLPRLNEEAQLIASIGNHTGCRVGDAAGLKMNDLYLHTNNEHPIPFIFFRDNSIRALTKSGVERRVPLFGDVLGRLVEYYDERIRLLNAKGADTINAPLFPRYGKGQRGAGAVSNLINQKHIHLIRNGDKKLTFHSFRHTLQHKYIAAGQNTQHAAYIAGWKFGGMVGEQAGYLKHGIPPSGLIDGLVKAHAAKSWGDADMDAQLRNRMKVAHGDYDQ